MSWLYTKEIVIADDIFDENITFKTLHNQRDIKNNYSFHIKIKLNYLT